MQRQVQKTRRRRLTEPNAIDARTPSGRSLPWRISAKPAAAGTTWAFIAGYAVAR